MKRKRTKAGAAPPAASARARKPVEWEAAFLASLREEPNLSKAARLVEINRSTVDEHRERYSDFDAAVKVALHEGAERLEELLFEQGTKGALKDPTRYEPSQALGVTLLKAHLPEKYRERKDVRVSDPDGKPLRVEVYLPALDDDPEPDDDDGDSDT